MRLLQSTLFVACALGAVLSAQEAFSPARYRDGMLPALPLTAVGGGEVFLELSVDAAGRVTDVIPLRTTPPFTDLVVAAVRDWRFLPAEGHATTGPGRAGTPASRRPVPSRVLVAAVYRPPALRAPTLGEPPRDVATPSEGTAFPVTTSMPPYPPSAYGSGVVLLEVRIGRDGTIADVTVIHSAAPFDDAARAAVRQWSFRPAHLQGMPVATLVYVLFGFPIPVGRG